MKHIISAEQFDRTFLEKIFHLARLARAPGFGQGLGSACDKKIMSTFFYEPSTRTRLSFESAMLRTGGSVISTDHAKDFSSVAKGEDIRDSIRTISGYADVIVLRSDEMGMAQKAAEVSEVPIINAGDGAGEHPTQALLDAYTIHSECDGIDGKVIALVGDLHHGRTVRSLAKVVANFDVKELLFVAPDALRMRTDIRDFLTARQISFRDEPDFKKAAAQADVVYMTRTQKERFGDRIAEYEASKGQYVMSAEILSVMKEKAIIMHPLPRNEEIAREVDDDPRAAYFRQAKNGLYVRMALLDMIFS